MKKILLLAVLFIATYGSKGQTTVVMDYDIHGEPCGDITSITFTLVSPNCQTVVTTTVYPVGGSGYAPSYTSSGLGYPGYNIISATLIAPVSCSSPWVCTETIGNGFTTCGYGPFTASGYMNDNVCQYFASWSVSSGTVTLHVD